ncbi:hypothetical protein ACIBCM_06380 [Streptomyces sp. NPDC051018]
MDEDDGGPLRRGDSRVPAWVVDGVRRSRLLAVVLIVLRADAR